LLFLLVVGVWGLVGWLGRFGGLGESCVRLEGPLVWRGNVLRVGGPWLMRAISWSGAIAMLLVGGHISLHGIPPIEAHWHEWLHGFHLHWSLEELANTGFGMVTGLVVGGVLAGIWATGVFQWLGSLVRLQKTEA